MSLVGTNREEQIWNYLLGKGFNAYGVAGLMGNLYAESGLNPINMQNSYEKKLNFTDDTYTTAVDNGDYTNFVRDKVGYGLAQWTYWSRKQKLHDFVKAAGKSIGDLETQLAFLCEELQKSYGSVYKILRTAKSVKEASNAVLLQYERPADQGTKVQEKRSGFGQKYYEKYAGAEQSQIGGTKMSTKSSAVVKQANDWIGKNEADGSFKVIIDAYNKSEPFPRSTKMLYSWAWCACFWSAIAKVLGYTKVMPIEISCYYIIEQAKKMGIWIEADNTVPKPGYAVLYDWDDSGKGDNTGNADHIGVVTEVYESASNFVVVEGNYSNSVKKRTLSINGRYIRGFIAPKYDTYDVTTGAPQVSGKDIKTIAREVIAGVWGNGTARNQALEKAGYSYSEVQKAVNQILNGGAIEQTKPVAQTTKSLTASDAAQKFNKTFAGAYKTTADLYLRHGAGTNKKAMVVMPKGTTVNCYGYYSMSNGVKWYYVVATVDGVKYTGFCSSNYLNR